MRNRQVADITFARQVPIGPYIVDIAARSARMIIEVDGATHTDQAGDERRTAWLNQQGYCVIRFSNLDVVDNIEGVRDAIVAALGATPHPGPRPAGEREQAV